MLVAVLALGACGGPAEPAGPPPFNSVDVMFLQMGLEQIKDGDQVAALAEQRATGAELRALTTELRGQWRTESGTMQRWLLGWQQPLVPDPNVSAHAGHGDLHSLRSSDLDELRAARGPDFDRTALSLLLGHLHNCVDTARMESAGGGYPPARSFADAMTRTRQGQIQRMLVLAA